MPAHFLAALLISSLSHTLPVLPDLSPGAEAGVPSLLLTGGTERPIPAAQAIMPEINEDRLTRLMDWIARRFDLPPTQDYPRIVFATPDTVAAMRYRGLALVDAKVAARRTVAIYSDAERTIYLPDSWDGSPAAMSVLVHELVHHMQNVADMRFNCLAERENIAYRAQSAWLIQNGTSLEDEFNIDAFSVLVKTNCMH